MRLFVALHPDAGTRAWLADAQKRLRKELRRWGRELRWTDPEKIHLTLVFLGEIPEAAPIVTALEGCRCEPMNLTVAGLGVFPNPHRPAVLWAGLSEPTGALAALQAEIAGVLTPFVQPERRPFAPHLTLARIQRGGFRLGDAVTTLAEGWGDAPQPWHVERFSLMQSEIGTAGARHSVVREFGPGARGAVRTRFLQGMDTERWEHFSHEADIGVRGFGLTKEAAFAQAALAALAVIVDLEAVHAREPIDLVCEAPDDVLLLVDWLNAVVFEIATRKMLFSRFEVHIDGQRLEARLWGEPIDLERHRPCVEIKGATYTEARVDHTADGSWVAQCVVDV
jgi:tRNA nucleotidyltransferase (CCA-adding enzyme)